MKELSNPNVSGNNSTLHSSLTKESTDTQIRAYFEAVLNLSKSNEQFPVNLDEVWPLVYADKKHAVRSLKANFIESVDYQPVLQNGERSDSGRFVKGDSITYKLTVPCLEYFVARKNKAVFEVYRSVFHKVVEQKPLSQLEIIAQSAQILLEQDKRLNHVEKEVLELKAKTSTRPDYFTIVGYGTRNKIPVNLKQASSLGRKASDLCKRRGIQTDKILDPRFGEVKMYPREVLEEIFNQPLN